MKEITINSKKRSEIIDITEEVSGAVKESKAKEGICIVYCPHTTAGIIINENADSSVKSDILNALGRIVPGDGEYLHAEENSDAHIKSAIVGTERIIPITNSKLNLGQWQSIQFCEFDGPRARKVLVEVIGK